jgi:hypothetical protein
MENGIPGSEAYIEPAGRKGSGGRERKLGFSGIQLLMLPCPIKQKAIHTLEIRVQDFVW